MADLVILFFAIWRISSFISSPDVGGPWDVLHWFRHFVGMRYDEYSRLYGLNVFAQGLACSVCASIWVGFPVGLLYFLAPDYRIILLLVLFPFAAGGISRAIDSLLDKV